VEPGYCDNETTVLRVICEDDYTYKDFIQRLHIYFFKKCVSTQAIFATFFGGTTDMKSTSYCTNNTHFVKMNDYCASAVITSLLGKTHKSAVPRSICFEGVVGLQWQCQLDCGLVQLGTVARTSTPCFG